MFTRKRFLIPFEGDNTFNIINFEKEGRNGFLFIIFLALHEFYSLNNNQLPEINNIQHSNLLSEMVEKLYNEFKEQNVDWFDDVEELNKNIISYISFWSRCEISPLCCFLGGILCHEIIKFTGKYYPINQWFCFDFFELIEILNENKNNINRDILNPSRYDEQISIFGNEIQEKLSKLNIFMPGVGAIGCEVLKNMALMGISTAQDSQFTITDYDLIEISNLSRQFLFQNEHIGLSKSKIAYNVIKEVNNSFNCVPYFSKIGYESEDIFDYDFFEKQDFLISAVDSNEARYYLDEKSIQLHKVLINSGTLGPVSKYDLVIPKLTSCLHDIPEKPKKEFGLCTIRKFPSQIDHCVQWTKNYFIEWICQGISDIKNIFINTQNNLDELTNFNGSVAEAQQKYYIIEKYLDILINQSIDYCVEFVIFQFFELFNITIKQILLDYPVDSLDEQGEKFWKGTKLPPHPLELSLNDNMSFSFIQNYTILLLNALSLKYNEDEISFKKVEEIFKSFDIKKFLRKKNYENDENKNRIKEKINYIIDKEKNKEIKEIEFDKDNLDKNCIKFIEACSNLRARNYNIEESNEDNILFIIGNIQPSLISSTAAISGLLCMQIFSLIQIHSTKYCLNGFLSLVNLNLHLSEPISPKIIADGEKDNLLDMEIKAIPHEWTIWDQIVINKSFTCNEFILDFKKNYNVDINNISINGIEIFYKRRTRKKNSKKEEEEKIILSKKLEMIYCEKTNKEINKIKNLYLNVLGKYENYIAKIPLILYKFKK